MESAATLFLEPAGTPVAAGLGSLSPQTLAALQQGLLATSSAMSAGLGSPTMPQSSLPLQGQLASVSSALQSGNAGSSVGLSLGAAGLGQSLGALGSLGGAAGEWRPGNSRQAGSGGRGWEL